MSEKRDIVVGRNNLDSEGIDRDRLHQLEVACRLLITTSKRMAFKTVESVGSPNRGWRQLTNNYEAEGFGEVFRLR